MDIGSISDLSTQMSSGKVNNAVGMHMLKKSLDAEEIQANQVLQSIVQPNPNIGSRVDMRA